MIRLVFVFILSLVFAPAAIASVTLPWETTFNCPEWTQSDGLSVAQVNCDGIQGQLASTTTAGSEEQITSAANYSLGGGGRGQRHWLASPEENNSGGLKVLFDSTQSEIWLRWYMRYEAGFTLVGLDEQKWIYMLAGSSTVGRPYLGWYDTNRVRFVGSGALNSTLNSATGNGWEATQGGATSDGAWDLYEIHLKMDTNGANGIAQMWINETLVINSTNADFGTTAGWAGFYVPSNMNAPGSATDMYQDFDDFALNNTGYIGPLSGGGGGGGTPTGKANRMKIGGFNGGFQK